MNSDDALAKWNALTAAIWVEVLGLGFRKFAEVCAEHERAKGYFQTLAQGIGGPGGAHLLEIDGSVNESPQGVEVEVTAIRFLAYVNVPSLRKKRTIGMVSEYDGAKVQFEEMVSLRPTVQGIDPLEWRRGPSSLSDLWAFHKEELSACGMSVISLEGEPAQWVAKMDASYGKALEDDERTRWETP